MKIFKRKTEDDSEIEKMARKILLHYLQSWGQSVEERRQILNEAVKFVGIKAEFIQDGDRVGWEHKKDGEGKRASKFRLEIESCWPKGQFEWEHTAICNVLSKYKNRQ